MPEYLVASGVPSYPPGLSDQDAALVAPLYRALGNLAQQVSELTGRIQLSQAEQGSLSQLTLLQSQRLNRIFVKAGEALSYGQLVNLTVSSGKIVAVKADATVLTKPAHAIVDKPGGIANGTFGEVVFMQGRTASVTGTTFGAAYYLSTAGNLQITPPVATGVINQIVGIGLGSEGLWLNIEPVGRRVAYAYKFSASVLRVLYTDGTSADLAV